ncbi:MAG: DUF3343 domain-containing protein [Desulfitobacteriaceae bacterium]|jgi:hypothetical protein|nr:DUF3343 domain-containing protein [Desulfitobacteriaceae bacterium]MDD4751920.1 DUF3343 domain-containing protein [Desulfitobacteriaceae bacterium]
MGERVCLILTFYSSHFAIKLESVCQDNGIPGKLIPVPRSISSSCGIALQAEVRDQEIIEQVAKEKGIEIERVVEYKIEERKSILHSFFSGKSGK